MTLTDAREATERLHHEEPPFGLDYAEAICAICMLAYYVTPDFDFGVCPDCLTETLERLDPDLIEE